MITSSIFWAIISSTVVATMIGVVLTWIKEYFQKRNEKEEKQFEKLYGAITYHFLAIKVLSVNRSELIEEINKEPMSDDTNAILKKWGEINPVNAEWRRHIYELKNIFENNAGYINKKHLKLVEDLLDGFVKRDITKEGSSIRTTEVRIKKLFDAINALQDELLGK